MEQHYGSSSVDRLPVPVVGGRSLTTDERFRVDLSESIAGWGSDLDPERRAGVPRDKDPELGAEALYPPIERQQPRFRIHKSTEHAQLTPVFGTSCPPSGLSGMIRDAAYRISEGRKERWVMLLAADRVDVAEGLVDDLAHGRLPNVVREMGLRSELPRTGTVVKAAVALGCIAAVVALARSRAGDRDHDRDARLERPRPVPLLPAPVYDGGV